MVCGVCVVVLAFSSPQEEGLPFAPPQTAARVRHDCSEYKYMNEVYRKSLIKLFYY